MHSCSVELEGLQRIFLKLLNPLRWERSRNSQATLLCSFYSFAEILIIFPGTCAAVQRFRPGHQLKNSPVAAHSGPFVCFREDFFPRYTLTKKELHCTIFPDLGNLSACSAQPKPTQPTHPHAKIFRSPPESWEVREQ